MEQMENFFIATGEQRLVVKFIKTERRKMMVSSLGTELPNDDYGVVIQVWDEDRCCSIELAEFQIDGLIKGLKK